jgi:predicted nucleic acid-binding protein
VIYFFDTSALLKRYLNEVGSVYIRRLLGMADSLFYQTFLTSLEVTSALYRQHRTRQLSAEDLSIFLKSYAAHSHEEYLLVPYSASVMDLSNRLIARHPIRALDAIQLASVLWLRDHLPGNAPAPVFVSADDRLVRFSLQEHLHAENPEKHS